MDRIYDEVDVNGKQFHTIFDSGALRSYIIRKSACQVGFQIILLKTPFQTALGGEKSTIRERCIIEGKLGGNPFEITAYVLEDLGTDEKGKEIELLFGATDMQIWNIQIDMEKERLDLTRFRKEFIEYLTKSWPFVALTRQRGIDNNKDFVELLLPPGADFLRRRV